MLKEYDDMKEEIKNLKAPTVYQRFEFIYRIQKVKTQKLQRQKKEERFY